MSLAKYHAVQKVLALTARGEGGWNVRESTILAIETLLKPYVDEGKFVLIPRYNDTYISFRYCGLEILRLSKAGGISTCIESTGKGIRGSDKEKPVTRLEEITPLLDQIKEFLDGYMKDFTVASTTHKQAKAVPGFSLEHWMESIILGDTPVGEAARARLGLNKDLAKVVSQAPVILVPATDGKLEGKKRRHHHIDLLSMNDDGRIVVVELKKDNALGKAIKELEEYTHWLLKDGAQFDKARGNPEAMVTEHYLPGRSEAFSNLVAAKIEAVAVVIRSGRPAPAQLSNGVTLTVVDLPTTWLSRKGSIFS